MLKLVETRIEILDAPDMPAKIMAALAVAAILGILFVVGLSWHEGLL